MSFFFNCIFSHGTGGVSQNSHKSKAEAPVRRACKVKRDLNVAGSVVLCIRHFDSAPRLHSAFHTSLFSCACFFYVKATDRNCEQVSYLLRTRFETF